ncbi:MAG: manganese efflux pump [Atopobiaceae bacterium]|nr:manganese efflux pump [Atopobiaceae bacterium]
MSFVELFLIAVGLSMDAFSVSVCKGLGMRRIDWKTTLVLALAFGGFQAGMPVIGWALGSQLLWLIEPVDHWIAFGLLAFIGGNMIREALSDEEDDASDAVSLKEVLILAVATSIDALTMGIAFASLSVNIWLSVALIGVTTFVLSVVGVLVGNQFGMRYQKPSQIAGGIILILIGLKVLLEHLGILVL